MDLDILTTSVEESDGQVTAVVRLSQAFSQDIQFMVAALDGTAMSKMSL